MAVIAPPRRAEGLELLGPYEDSGLKDPPFLVRRKDGRVIQLPRLLYQVLESVDGGHNVEELASRVSSEAEVRIEPDDLRMLLDEKLKPLGLLDGATTDGEGDTARTQRAAADPMLALKLRMKVVPPSVVRAVTIPFRPLFWPPVIVAVLAALGVFDWWLFTQHGVAQSLRSTLFNPAVIVLFFGLIVVSAAFHELGHATGCVYGGGKPGEMGAGLYVAWPVFYTDVTDAYRLGRGAKLRTDFGGVYFNAVFMLGVAGAYFATGFEPLLLVIVFQHFEVLHQFLPFFRLDGYYIVSDLTGVPDMFSRIGAIFSGLLPWRKTDPRAKELKPWARAVVSAWVLVFVPLMIFALGLMIAHLPRVFATAFASFGQQIDAVQSGFARGDVLAATAAMIAILALTLPLIAMPYTLLRVSTRLVRGGWRKTNGRPVARTIFLGATAALAGLMAYVWWPNGDYRSITPYERGTLVEGVASLQEIGTGAPGLAPLRRAEEARVAASGAESETSPEVQRVPPSEPQIAKEPAAESPDPSTSAEPSPEQSPTPDPTTQPTTEPTPTGEPS